jgi:type I restriction enzyme M protein
MGGSGAAAGVWFPWPSDPPQLDEEPPRLHRAPAALSPDDERRVVPDLLRADLAAKLEGHVVRRRRELSEVYRVWEAARGVRWGTGRFSRRL